MSAEDAGQQHEALAPADVPLSVGFWDAFASGSMWTAPVLAVLTFSQVGRDHLLILATDGSSPLDGSESKEHLKRFRVALSELASFSSNDSNRPQAEKEQQCLEIQYGRLLLRRETLPCEPRSLVNRLISLTVYSKCIIKGRQTPVVTGIQLLPGHWIRPNAPLVSHSLYATDSSNDGTGHFESKVAEQSGDSPAAPTAAEVPGGALPARKRRRAARGDGSKEKSTNCLSLVYAHSRSGPVAKAQRGVRTALSDLHLYSHQWEILARISYKSEVKSFANAKGESSLFTVHLIDNQATEIRATFFGRAVALWYSKLHVGGLYTFSKGTLQRANKLHNPLPHEVEIKFDAAAQIDEAPDDPRIPHQKFERVSLADIQQRPAGTLADILAFVVEAKEPQTIISRTKNEELVRRELTLLDSSGAFVSLSLFGTQAMPLRQEVLSNCPLVAAKGVRVNEYGGRACLSSSAQMKIHFFHAAATASEAADAPHGGEQCGVDKSEVVKAAAALQLEEPGTTRTFRVVASVFDLRGDKLVWL
ncbi:replication protein A 70 kDa DNA-binding subunit [Cyclospora cayetanensis]|uniref:Replication protein A 70 kDa DNA-binding subunit n=1 Tax=Cyclospora cayetanensis TaxID=88456 RepID=A0A6P6S0B7_9EIME|nr:replication protein A 70 kDa DNA-binding subunit [Cyclospora cayetanensis]